jgi:lysophospholipase L1-like esterase
MKRRLNTDSPKQLRHPLLVNILLAIGSTIIFGIISLGGFELYLRRNPSAWSNNNTDFDSELGWASIANRRAEMPFGTITSNSLGFRSGEINPAKDQIVVIGDSVSWGDGVGDQETFPYFLQQRLNASTTQVSNLAVSGYGFDQYYLFLARHISRFNNPKLVIVGICTRNDRGSTRANVAYGKRKQLFRAISGELTLDKISIDRYCLRNLVSKSRAITYLTDASNTFSDSVGNIVGDVRLSAEEGDEVLRLLIKKIEKTAEEKGAKTLFVILPEKADLIEKSEDQIWFENLFRSSGYDYVNLYETLEPQREQADKLYRDKMHFSAEGNRLYAEAVWARITEIK